MNTKALLQKGKSPAYKVENPGESDSSAEPNAQLRVTDGAEDSEAEEVVGDDGDDANQAPDEDEECEIDETTVQSIQEAININHPFGLRIWKPALYKKKRSIENKAETALLEVPDVAAARKRNLYLSKGNLLWLITGNWIAAATYALVGLILAAVVIVVSLVRGALYVLWGCKSPGERYYIVERFDYSLCSVIELYRYVKVLVNMSAYMLWPFGKFVRLLPAQKTDGFYVVPDPLAKTPSFRANSFESLLHARVPETEPLLAGAYREPPSDCVIDIPRDLHAEENPGSSAKRAPNLSLSQVWTSMRVQGFPSPVYYFFACTALAPMHAAVSLLAWLSIFSIPMAKLHIVILKYMLLCPLRLKAEHASAYATKPNCSSQVSDEHLNHYYAEGASRGHSLKGSPSASRLAQPFFGLPLSGNSQQASSRAQIKASVDGRRTTDSKPLPSIPGSSRAGFTPCPPPVLTPNIAPLLQRGYNYVSACPSNRTESQDIILGIYYAMGWRYYKYTLDGINIIFINLMAVVAFTLLDGYFLSIWFPDSWLSGAKLIFGLALVSVIPLAYFIGMAVSSITAETGSLALGAVINATFGSVIEIILYAMAILKGKTALVEGAIVGSFFCGLLTLPGVSMVSGALFKKEQRFNAKSAGVTATMLIVAVAGCFTPTFFQSIYGIHDVECAKGNPVARPNNVTLFEDCKFVARDPALDPFYQSHTKPLVYFCAVLLLLMYMIGLCFTLRTHSKQIYARSASSRRSALASSRVNAQEKAPQAQASTGKLSEAPSAASSPDSVKKSLRSHRSDVSCSSGSSASSTTFKTASTPSAYFSSALYASKVSRSSRNLTGDPKILTRETATTVHGPVSGHNSPNWSTLKSIIVLLVSTVSFSLLAEVIIDQVDHVFSRDTNSGINEKFLGLTLFALIPSVTEFYNAIAFAMYGNVGLSLEIGSAYVVQVALVQVPVLVGFSATIPFWCKLFNVSVPDENLLANGFNLIFPYWDTYTTIFSVFLLAYLYNEGKSNYFKGSMLLCCYALILCSYAYMPPSVY